ncbi:MAG: hypothetical protein L6Q76_22210, partial [Polyangiaceae bacterium]|nr:hypothetical protein [Polyangiaceae bacterium]
MTINATNTHDLFAHVRNLVDHALASQAEDHRLDVAALDPAIVKPLEQVPPITWLGQLGVIELVRGPGLRVVRANAKEDAEQAFQAATTLLEKISAAPDKQLTRTQLVAYVGNESNRARAIWLLKVLGHCTSLPGPGGGLQLVSKANEQVDEAKKTAPVVKPLEKETKYESALYPFVANVLTALEYETIVTGEKQRGDGEWSTPDVVGYWVGASKANVLPILRVATVEVKQELSRLGIAQARAHRRFAHHSYIAVPQAWPELMTNPLVLECRESGLGLICTKQTGSNTFYVHLDAPFQRPDEL